MTAVPERIRVAGVELVVHGPDEAAAVCDAVNASLDHLRPWMSWAHRPTTVQEQAMRLAMVVERARSGGDAVWSIVGADLPVAGACGLHRVPDDETSLDIGYWVHVDATRRGYATAAASALCRVAFEVMGAGRARITCDEANAPSAAVAARLGFVLEATVDTPPAAAADTGRTMVWVMSAAAWPASAAARASVSYC